MFIGALVGHFGINFPFLVGKQICFPRRTGIPQLRTS